MQPRHQRRTALTILTTLASILAASTVAVLPATAASATDRIAGVGQVDTGGTALRARSGPSSDFAQTGAIGKGTYISIVCQVVGQDVTGTVWTTRIWDRLPNRSYVADAYITRNWYRIPVCDPLTVPKLPTDPSAFARGGIPPGYQLPTGRQVRTAIAYALSKLGHKYIFGTEGPTTFDCSGLTMAAWATAGVNIHRTADAQSRYGAAVPGLSAMRPGDLIFIPGSDGTIHHPGHVGMYIGVAGDGKQYLVHAPHTGDVVKVTPVSSWSNQISAIRRPLGHSL
ncbi:MAG: hypothetical protein QOC94_805 [Actinoplanes sp.]|jgi:uncharacterized protein YraI|nr:hypothetical protein [Actinoplanes sp.]